MDNNIAYLEKLRRLKELKDSAAPEDTSVSLEGLGHSITNSLPALGGIVGAGIGTLAGPAGSMLGGGAGYALGSGAKDMIDQYAYDKPKEAVGIPGKVLETGKNMAIGAGLEGAGQLASPLVGQAVQKMQTATPISDLATKIGKPAVDFAAGLVPSRSLDNAVKTVGNAAIDSNLPLHADQVIQTIAGISSNVFNHLPMQYQSMLKSAAAQGTRQAAITHFLLSNQDPNYQKAVSDASQQE